ncbi:hypothetical protein [Rickettsiella endosymbiont of Xylota segnis]|uniref:hypothetical protein n=1 Tax=Rickettsiella endosymbiont of Xylota segnis TaxID=3066238 RepID=UPI0030D16EE1
MQLDGYCLKWNNIVIVFRKIDKNIPGKENPFPQYSSWEGLKFFMDFHRNVMPNQIIEFFEDYDSNDKIPFYFFAKPKRSFDISGGDKIPLKNLKKLEKLTELEIKLINNEIISTEDIISLGVLSTKDLGQNNCFSNSDSGQFSQDSSTSNSLGSISSAQFAVSTIDSSNAKSRSKLFTNESNNHLERRIKKIYTNTSKHTKDAVLSENDLFLDDIAKNRIKPAISFPKCVRVANITEAEMLVLKSSGQKSPMILGNKVK